MSEFIQSCCFCGSWDNLKLTLTGPMCSACRNHESPDTRAIRVQPTSIRINNDIEDGTYE